MERRNEYNFAYEFRRYAESLRKPIKTFRQNSIEEVVVEELQKEDVARAYDQNSSERQQLWKILNLLGIKDPKTGNPLTVHDAIKLKIFDFNSAKLKTPGEEEKELSIDDALKRGIIEPQMYDNLMKLHELSRKYEITINDKVEIDDGIDDADGSSEKRIKVIQFNENGAKSFVEAIDSGLVDSQSGLFRLADGTFITITEALNCGYLVKNETVKIKSTPISFSDALKRGLFDEQGFMIDRNSGVKYQLHSAIANGLILENLREIIDTKDDTKVTVKRALEIGLIDSKAGLFRNSLSNDKCTFNYAHNSHLISKPLTFKDLFDMALIKDNYMILSPTFSKWLSIREAIDAGVLDYDNFKCITKEKGSLVTLRESIESDCVSLDGKYKDIVTGEVISIKSAVERGLISSVSQKSIFDIDGFKCPKEEAFVSLNVALQKRILRRDDKYFVILASGNKFMTLDESVEGGLIRPEVFSMLMRHIGVYDDAKNELRLIDLVYFKLIDPSSGYLLNPKTGENLPLDSAIEMQMISAPGALLLSSLLNITLTTETITKTIKRYVTIKDRDLKSEEFEHPSFSEAVQRGLISINEQTYHQPDEQKYYKVQDALNTDHVLADTEKINANGSSKKAVLTIITKSFLPTNEQPQSSIKILKKMQKKVISLTDALHMGLINEETFELLENNVTFAHNPDSFLKSKKYKIKDPQSGSSLTIEEAIEREILNPNDITKFHIPFCKSLTIPQLIDRDLLDLESQMIIHPETGDLLTLNEAIACDIVDKYSLIRNDKKHKITIREAVKIGYIDAHSGIVIKSKKGELSVKAAIEKGLFDVEKSFKGLFDLEKSTKLLFDTEKSSKDKIQQNIPLIGQTFPVIVKRDLFNLKNREVLHKITNKKILLKTAIESDYIMSVPCVPNVHEIFIPDALDRNLIDFTNQTFKCPQTNVIMSLQDAYNGGFLIAKPLHAIISHETLNSTQITREVKNVSHTVKTKSIDILEGFTMTSANEVMNNKTGEIYSLQEAKDQGIAIERVEVNQFTTSAVESDDLPERTEKRATSEESETHITTIKKITIVKEIKFDENGKEILDDDEKEPEIFESKLELSPDREFDEIFKKFKQENPKFDQEEETVTETVTKVTKIFTQDDSFEEGVEATEFDDERPKRAEILISRPEKAEISVSRAQNDQILLTRAQNEKILLTKPQSEEILLTKPLDSEISHTTPKFDDRNVSETTTVEELPDDDRKKIVITTTRVISTKQQSENDEITESEPEPLIDNSESDSMPLTKTKTIIISTIKSVTERTEDEQKSRDEKVTKNINDITTQFLDLERSQQQPQTQQSEQIQPVPAPRKKKTSIQERVVLDDNQVTIENAAADDEDRMKRIENIVVKTLAESIEKIIDSDGDDEEMPIERVTVVKKHSIDPIDTSEEPKEKKIKTSESPESKKDIPVAPPRKSSSEIVKQEVINQGESSQSFTELIQKTVTISSVVLTQTIDGKTVEIVEEPKIEEKIEKFEEKSQKSVEKLQKPEEKPQEPQVKEIKAKDKKNKEKVKKETEKVIEVSKKVSEKTEKEPEKSVKESEKPVKKPEKSNKEPEQQVKEPEKSFKVPEKPQETPEKPQKKKKKGKKEPKEVSDEIEKLREPKELQKVPEEADKTLDKPHKVLEQPQKSTEVPEKIPFEPSYLTAELKIIQNETQIKELTSKSPEKPQEIDFEPIKHPDQPDSAKFGEITIQKHTIITSSPEITSETVTQVIDSENLPEVTEQLQESTTISESSSSTTTTITKTTVITSTFESNQQEIQMRQPEEIQPSEFEKTLSITATKVKATKLDPLQMFIDNERMIVPAEFVTPKVKEPEKVEEENPKSLSEETFTKVEEFKTKSVEKVEEPEINVKIEQPEKKEPEIEEKIQQPSEPAIVEKVPPKTDEKTPTKSDEPQKPERPARKDEKSSKDSKKSKKKKDEKPQKVEEVKSRKGPQDPVPEEEHKEKESLITGGFKKLFKKTKNITSKIVGSSSDSNQQQPETSSSVIEVEKIEEKKPEIVEEKPNSEQTTIVDKTSTIKVIEESKLLKSVEEPKVVEQPKVEQKPKEKAVKKPKSEAVKDEQKSKPETVLQTKSEEPKSDEKQKSEQTTVVEKTISFLIEESKSVEEPKVVEQPKEEETPKEFEAVKQQNPEEPKADKKSKSKKTKEDKKKLKEPKVEEKLKESKESEIIEKPTEKQQIEDSKPSQPIEEPKIEQVKPKVDDLKPSEPKISEPETSAELKVIQVPNLPDETSTSEQTFVTDNVTTIIKKTTVISSQIIESEPQQIEIIEQPRESDKIVEKSQETDKITESDKITSNDSQTITTIVTHKIIENEPEQIEILTPIESQEIIESEPQTEQNTEEIILPDGSRTTITRTTVVSSRLIKSTIIEPEQIVYSEVEPRVEIEEQKEPRMAEKEPKVDEKEPKEEILEPKEEILTKSEEIIKEQSQISQESSSTVTTTIITSKIIEASQPEFVNVIAEFPKDVKVQQPTLDPSQMFINNERMMLTPQEPQISISETTTVKSPTELVKVKQFTVAENEIEVIPLRDAIKQGKIEPKICRIMLNGNELPMTVHDALQSKEISPTDVVQVISSHIIVLIPTQEKAYLLNFKDRFNELLLNEMGLYDSRIPSFIDPWNGNQVTFEYLIFNLDVLDPSIYVKDHRNETYVPIKQAFTEKLIDPQLGTVSSQQIPIFDAVTRRLVIQKSPHELRIVKRPPTIQDLIANGNINFESDEVIVNNENLSLCEALRQGAIDTNQISIRDPATNDLMGYKYAVDRGIVNVPRGVIINLITMEEMLLIVAYKRGFMLIGRLQPVSLNAAIQSEFYDKKSNSFKSPFDGRKVTLKEAIDCGIIDPKLTDVKDPKNNSLVPLRQAIEFNLVDTKAGMVKNKKSAVPLDKAVKEKLIVDRNVPLDLAEVITKNYYDPQTGKILNPYSNRFITIREAIKMKIINIYHIRIYDVVHDQVYSVDEAIANGLLDDEKGIVTRPKMTLDKAYLQRILISFNGPLSLPSALQCNVFDPQTRKYSFDDQKMNLSEAIENKKIAGNELVLYEPNRLKLSTLNEAISSGFLDPIESVIVDPVSNKEVGIDDAMEQGLLVKSRSDVNLRDAVFQGLYDPHDGSFSNVQSVNDEKLPLDLAINRNVVDVKSTIVNVDNVTLDFEQAIEKGFIDPKTSVIQTQSGDKLNLIEAFDQGILNTISKPVRLHEAIIKNLYDESCGLFVDPETRKKITIQESIHESLIDPNSIQIQDPSSKSYLPISINFAIQTGLINPKNGTVNYDNKTYTLREAFDLGILIDSKGPVSIQRTIHQGTFDEKLGRISDPFSDKKITIHEGIRKYVVNPHLPCYFDEEKEILLSLNDTCKHKLIDRFQGNFTVPYSGEKLTLNEAMKLNWIIDIESGNFTLYKLIHYRLINHHNGKLIHPVTNRELSLNQAIESELVDPLSSFVKNRNNKYISLSDALKLGVIDGVSNVYWLNESQSIPLYDAIEKGLIVSNEKPYSLQNAIKMRLYRPETGKFVDPETNTFYDLKTALEANLINGDSAKFKNILTKQTKPLEQAINDGDVNIAKGRVFDQKSGQSFNYDVAFERGLLINIPRGSCERKAIVHEDIPAIKIDLVDASKPREMTLDEVINSGIINPDISLIKDPQTGKFILLRIFIEKYQINLAQKAIVDPNAAFFVFSPNCVIYNREPKSFDDVIESNELNLATGKLNVENESKEMSIQEAIDGGFIDPDTILIKDGAKSKLLSVNEALRKGLVDPERSYVVDSTTSKMHNLENALKEGLLKTPKKQFDLLEALQFNLYDDKTGEFVDPFATEEAALVTFESSIAKGLIDPSTTMVRATNDSEIFTISSAITSGLIDPVKGEIVIKDSNERINFVKAMELGLLVPAGERQAVIERFALCEENISILLKWINDIEQRLSKIGGPQEHVEELQLQINILKHIKNDIDVQTRPVASCLEQVRQLVLTSGNVLSVAEVTQLENSGRQLRFRVDRSHDTAMKLLKHLQNSFDELDKLNGEIYDFGRWVQSAQEVLENEHAYLSDLKQLPAQSARIKDLLKEIIAHQADLRFITISTQKFVDEGKEYLQVINDLRISLPERLPNIEPIASFKSPVRQTVSELQQRYSDLLNQANIFADRQNNIRESYRMYLEHLEKARSWLSDIQLRVSSVIAHPVGTDIETIQEQSNIAKSLYNEFLANGKLIDNLQSSLNTLLVALTGVTTPSENAALEIPVEEIKRDYKSLLEAVDNRCKMLEVAYVQAQGVQDALDNLIAHMKQTEDKIHLQSQPASLIVEKLLEQIREHQFILSDLETHRASLNSVTESAKDLLKVPSNARLAKVIETKLHNVTDHYSRLRDKAMSHNDFLETILKKLTKFNNDSTIVENELKQLQELANIDEKSVDILMKYLQDVVQNRKKIQPAYDDCMYLGRELVERKDVTDTYVVKDKLKRLQTMWDSLERRLDDKLKLTKQKAEKLAAFEVSRQEILLWLSQMEMKTASFETVALDLSVIRKQSDEHKLLVNEFNDFNKIIQRINDIGAEYDSLIRTSSPIHNSGVDRQDLTDLTSIKQELLEINNRYNFIGVLLNDRQKDLNETRSAVQRQKENLEGLNSFLDKLEKNLPKYNLTVRENAEKCIKHVRKQQDEMYERQTTMDTTKIQIRELVAMKPNVPGADSLRHELENLLDRWQRISDLLKECMLYSEKSLDFIETYDLIFNWLVSKEKLLSVLGPISSDPRTVSSQMQQVSVLRDEFKAQHTQLEYLKDVGGSLINHFQPVSQEGKTIINKMNDIEKKWNELADQLEKRYKNLTDVADTSKDFDASLNRLRENLQQISDALDNLPNNADFEGKLQKISQLERQLEGQRPLLADAEATAATLTSVISDAKSCADIKAKVQALGKQYLALQKKLDNIKAENEAALKDKKHFLENCAKTIGWIASKLANFSTPLLISAHKPTLQYQIETHEPIYREVISKEYEIIMLLNRGKDLQQKLGELKDLEKIHSQWIRLKDEAQDRQTRLQKAFDLYKNYEKTSSGFLQWLSNAERDLIAMKPGILVKKDLDKEMRDVQTLRNDVLKKSSDYDKTQNLCGNFLNACDVDKDTLMSEMQTTKDRWEELNRLINLKLEKISGFIEKVMDFNDNFRQLSALVQRNEDAFDSLERIHGVNAGRDPRSLEKIKTIKDDNAELKKNFQNLRIMVENIATEARPAGYNSDNLYADLERLSDRILTLQGRLDDRFNDLTVASNAVAKFNESINAVGIDLSALENEVDSLSPPAREVKIVKSQLDTANDLLHKIEIVTKKITEIEHTGDAMIEKGFIHRPSDIHEPLDQVKRKRSRLESRTKDYLEAVQKALKNLTKFYQDYDTALSDISQIDFELKKLKTVGSEAQQIRMQQQDFQQFRRNIVDPMDRKIDDLSDLGKDLIRSAHETISTAILEGDLEKVIEKWSEIKSRVAERDRKLEQALLQSGKFQDALQGILKWLQDSEDMIRNQKPPSIDYKVVKAQLQEQKFLMKMIGDNQNSISSILKLGEEVLQGCDAGERINIELALKDLTSRYDHLKNKSNDRTKLLENAVEIAKTLQDQLTPLVTFLDRAERTLKNLENIPSDEDKIQQSIFEHDRLHKEILSKDPEVAGLISLKNSIRKYFEPEEAEIANEKIDSVSDRYGMLRDDSERLGALLHKTRQEIKQFSIAYQDLFAWCDKQERALQQFKNISVHVDVINEQLEKLEGINGEIRNKESTIQTTIDVGNELIRSISQDEALKLKDKLDSLGRRYIEISNKAVDYLNNAKDALALAQDFHDAHNRLVNWMQNAESILVGNAATEIEILTLESDLTKMRSELEALNSLGPQLAQLSSEEGGATIEGIITRDNRRFDAIVEQIQRKTERLQIIAQRSKEINIDLDELIQWFRETERNLKDANPPSIQPKVVKSQLNEHRALNDSISGQKGRVREVTANAKKLIRELQSSNDNLDAIREKLEDLKDVVDSVTNLSAERLSILEQVAPLSEHFADANEELDRWLSDTEHEISMLTAPGVRADQIMQQQEKNERLMQTVANHKPLIDKFNKTGEAFAALVTRHDGNHIHDIVEGVNSRYNALKTELRERQLALERALQETSQFADKLENMLRTLANAAEQVKNSEPNSAHPPRISNQIDENWGIAEDLEKREPTLVAIKIAADEIIAKATNHADPAVKDIKMKLEKLNVLWVDVQKEVKIRDSSLNDTLVAAEKFWNELDVIMGKLRELKDTLTSQEPVATEPKAIQRQQNELEEVGREIKNTKPEVDQVRICGNTLITLVGDADKPEIKKHIEDLDIAWGNITALYAQREENLIQAMEKAMQFHETLEALLRFLDEAEDYIRNLKPIGAEIVLVKQQIEDHKRFKDRVNPYGVGIEALNRQLNELSEITSVDQTSQIRNGVNSINKRWDALKQAMNDRQKQLENALLQLGQFEHALNELLVWIKKTQGTFEQIKIVPGDAKLLEIEMAKLKILINDAQAHQNSIDTINDAGRKLLENDGLLDASATREKLDNLNRQWQELQRNISDKERELDEELAEAQNFATEMQDILTWLNDVDSVVSSTKPVGGLPETATEQLEKFMEIYNEIEHNRPKVDNLLGQGANYVKKHGELNVTSSNLQHSLRTLKQRWEAVVAKAADKKIKLEIALKEATDFHESLQAFVEWLTDAEKRLTAAESISRVLPTVTKQVEEHKAFQKEIGNYRESMLQLDKKGSHLKYFSQKQDVILIKNLLVSVQHRWERVVNKGTERMRALDHGLKESKEFYDAWTSLTGWLRENENQMNRIDSDLNGSNDPVRVKQALEQIQNIHRGLSAKQGEYDALLRSGKGLIDKAPKSDEPELNKMLNELKELWTRNCARSIERQRKLEETLLLSGQFSEALTSILEYLQKAKIGLTDETPCYGDIDTVTGLVDKHKRFEADLEKRSKQIETIIANGKNLDPSNTAPAIINNLREVEQLWSYVKSKNEQRNDELKKALKEAEKLHKQVNILMEWLSDAEQKLKYAPAIPSDEAEAQRMLSEFNVFLYELRDKEFEKNETLSLAQNILNKAHPDAIKILRTIIQTIQQRWDEISQWALNRENKLSSHLQSLKDLDGTIDDLLAWLNGLERTLKNLEAEDLPNSVPVVEQLIEDHKEFMENTAGRQNEIDMICKPSRAKPTLKDAKRTSKLAMRTTSRLSPSAIQEAKAAADSGLPHYGPKFSPGINENEFRSPRAKTLWDKWRNVWMLAWDRQKRLHEHLMMLREQEKVQSFDWDDWRKRFLKFHNHKRSRVVEFLKKIDKKQNGLIPRDDFVTEIIKSKAPTKRYEVEAVADKFENDGFIDWEEFLVALRPEWQQEPKHEADKIHDEVRRLVMLCTCRQKFRVFQVGEGKYRFGAEQKLRLVRILRSTVMVRVGGGWIALDEFLLKNDPCRARGKTNTELREEFVLAAGVSQTMQAFTPRASISAASPHKSSRDYSSKSRQGSTTADSDQSDSVSIGRRTPSRTLLTTKTSIPVRSSLTPSTSRPTSKPASRHGSSLSLASNDDATPTRIPTRKAGSTPRTPTGSRPPSSTSTTPCPSSGRMRLVARKTTAEERPPFK